MENRPWRTDLRGDPAVNAMGTDCGICECGNLVGIDLMDRIGITIAHGHMDIETAEAFHSKFGETIELVRAKMSVCGARYTPAI